MVEKIRKIRSKSQKSFKSVEDEKAHIERVFYSVKVRQKKKPYKDDHERLIVAKIDQLNQSRYKTQKRNRLHLKSHEPKAFPFI